MLEQLIKLYTMYMATGVTSPLPHFVGPPGSGKSTIFQQLADLMDVKLHVVNVSRISPLGLEGLEMPNSESNMLELLISELWTKAQDGDIYLFDEFLRGFPEVYNGLLDIFTSREVAGYRLKRVFIAGASNSTVTYDMALEDRLLHIPVPDPRKKKAERNRLCKMLVSELGLLPAMSHSTDMADLFEKEVLPTFDLLDQFKRQANRANVNLKGTSLRKLIGQAKLRHVTSTPLKELISSNNALALLSPGQAQYVFLLTGDHAPAGYETAARALDGNPKLTRLQQQNITLNLQLIELDRAKKDAREDNINDDDSFD